MDKAALLAEIVEWGRAYPDKLPDDVSRKDYATVAGIDLTTAVRRLDRMVREGKLIKCRVWDEQAHQILWIYRKA